MVDRGSLDLNKNLTYIHESIREQAPVDRVTWLAPDFEPSPYDVICGRGKIAFNHAGNHRFRVTIDIYLQRYSKAKTKLEKSIIVMSIVDIFRQNSPTGGFVKRDTSTGRWFEVGDAVAREKVGQALREALLAHHEPEKHKAKKMRKASLKKARRDAANRKNNQNLLSAASQSLRMLESLTVQEQGRRALQCPSLPQATQTLESDFADSSSSLEPISLEDVSDTFSLSSCFEMSKTSRVDDASLHRLPKSCDASDAGEDCWELCTAEDPSVWSLLINTTALQPTTPAA